MRYSSFPKPERIDRYGQMRLLLTWLTVRCESTGITWVLGLSNFLATFRVYIYLTLLWGVANIGCHTSAADVT